MPTRHEIQIALDLINRVNIINDLCDVCDYFLRFIDPDSGTYLEKRVPVQEGPDQYTDYTVEEIKQTVVKRCNAIKARTVQINDFLRNVDVNAVDNGLSSLGVTRASITSDLTAMNDEANYILANISGALTKTSLETIAAHVTANIPKLKLVRRPWNAGD